MNDSIFQILITDGPVAEAERILHMNARSFRELHPTFRYRLLGKDEIEGILHDHFERDVLQSFRKPRPYSYKADLARLCLLHQVGGIYADLVMRLLHPLLPAPGEAMLCFRDAPAGGAGLWTVINGLIYAEARRPELECAIRLIVEHCRDAYFGATPLHPTGPRMKSRYRSGSSTRAARTARSQA